MNRFKKFIIKYIFKYPKMRKTIKELVVDYNYLPSEWHYIKLKEICDDILNTAKVDVVIEGIENVPKDTCVFYANHQSLIDPLLFLYINKEIGFILKKELKKYEVIDNIVKVTNSLYMNREDTKEGLKTILEAIENIKKGHSYVIFPEGTRTGNQLKEFHAGSFKMSTKTKTPIVPVCIMNTKEAIESKNMKKTSVKIKILKPITYEEYKDKNTKVIADTVKDLIQQEIMNSLNN